MVREKKTQMSESWMLRVERELGGIAKALQVFEGFRTEVMERFDRQAEKLDDQGTKLDRAAGALTNVETALKSTSTVVSSMALEKCGERLDRMELTMKAVEQWRWLLGGTVHAIWKLIGLLVASGVLGSFLGKLIPWHPFN